MLTRGEQLLALEPEQFTFEAIAPALDLVRTFASAGLISDVNLAVRVLSDVHDLTSVACVPAMLAYIERRLSHQRDARVFGAKPSVSGLSKELQQERQGGLALLRLLNDTLKRLPRSGRWIEAAGRVLLLLSKIFPMSDRSAVNQRGLFNTSKDFSFDESVTVAVDGVHDEVAKTDKAAKADSTIEAKEDERGEKAKDDEQLNLDEKKGKQKDSKRAEEMITDDELRAIYRPFWSLQHTFLSPEHLFGPAPRTFKPEELPAGPLRADKWDELRETLVRTLELFAKQTRHEKALGAGSAAASMSKSTRYLTDYTLFALEVRLCPPPPPLSPDSQMTTERRSSQTPTFGGRSSCRCSSSSRCCWASQRASARHGAGCPRGSVASAPRAHCARATRTDLRCTASPSSSTTNRPQMSASSYRAS